MLNENAPAQTDIPGFYCPTRRKTMEATGQFAQLHRVDEFNPLLERWVKGGNDYAGCAGSGDVFNEQARAMWDLTPLQMEREFNNNNLTVNQQQLNIGVFGVNSSVSIDDLKDGTSQTILIGENSLN